MPILRINDLCTSFGPHVVLEDANFQLFKGERVCLVGRNGAGKSTFLKLIAGDIKPDSGTVWHKPTVTIARLEQELMAADEATVYERIASGLPKVGGLLNRYEQLVAGELDDKRLAELERVQHEIDALDGWSFQQRIDEVASRLDLPKQAKMSTLSGGWRKRVALAKALVCDPDILLLDEPTNHLDIESIEWLERQILDFDGAVFFITHDRALARSLATQILELDRGTLRAFRCGYDKFLEERAHLLEVEERQNALFDKKLAQEEAWIRQGIKARRTRNEGRVRALKKLREERSERRVQQGVASFSVESASNSGKLVIEGKSIGFHFDDKTLFSNLNFNVLRGDKIGLLGPNGVGKTTLLKVLLGELKPTSGSVKLGTSLDIAYFDQMREHLDGDKTIVDIVGQGRESITINGKDRHILSYLGDFLFSPQRARTPLRSLSGGERNRVQLACLFSLPANLLVLDEPTNDLDVETLELLESILVEFTGTVLLVSHDRDFMDNVVTSTLAFEGQGVVREYVGGYQDWLRQGGVFASSPEGSQAQVTPEEKDKSPTAEEPLKENSPETNKSAKKLSYKLQRELDSLPAEIERLEALQEELQAETSAADFYQQEHAQVTERLEALAEATKQLEHCYERWVELSE